MITKIYSIKDIKAEVFDRPFYLQNRAIAIRSFTDEANNPQSLINKHPEDYDLYEIGHYDDTDAGFTIYDKPELILNASDVVIKN